MEKKEKQPLPFRLFDQDMWSRAYGTTGDFFKAGERNELLKHTVQMQSVDQTLSQLSRHFYIIFVRHLNEHSNVQYRTWDEVCFSCTDVEKVEALVMKVAKEEFGLEKIEMAEVMDYPGHIVHKIPGYALLFNFYYAILAHVTGNYTIPFLKVMKAVFPLTLPWEEIFDRNIYEQKCTSRFAASFLLRACNLARIPFPSITYTEGVVLLRWHNNPMAFNGEELVCTVNDQEAHLSSSSFGTFRQPLSKLGLLFLEILAAHCNSKMSHTIEDKKTSKDKDE